MVDNWDIIVGYIITLIYLPVIQQFTVMLKKTANDPQTGHGIHSKLLYIQRLSQKVLKMFKGPIEGICERRRSEY